MAELLLAGVTHYPDLNYPDRQMANLLRYALKDPGVPEHEKDPANWPSAMREDWEHHDESAARHRAALVENFRSVRQVIDDFAPDVIVLWGDDQYENFREDVVPPYCVLAYGDTVTYPWKRVRAWDEPRDESQGAENVWGEPGNWGQKVVGAPQIGRYLTEALLKRDIDMAYAYQPLHFEGLAHAFLNTVMFLDYERTGFSYPVLPIAVNCYGSRVITNHAGPVHFGQEFTGVLDPPAPAPRRCFAMGAATAEAMAESPWRCVIMASSSWSHAFLTDSTWRMRPDTESDLKFYDALREGNWGVFRDVQLDDLVTAGQQELLNWCALAGALDKMDASVDYLTWVESTIFNSNKCFLLAHPGGAS